MVNNVFQTGKLSDEQILSNRQEILSLLSSVHRRGMDRVISYLERSSFFETPNHIHSRRHHCWYGGLAQHSLGVCRLLLQQPGLDKDSCIIVGLLHDICKADTHYKDEDGQWHTRATLHYHGHGRRSLKLLQRTCRLELTRDEAWAILYHMHDHGIPQRVMNCKLHAAVFRCDHANAASGD